MDTDVVQRGVEGVGQRVALGVEPPLAGAPATRVRRIAPGDPEPGRLQRHGILEHGAEIEGDDRAAVARAARGVLVHPELQVLDARQVRARGGQQRGEGAPARPRRVRQEPAGTQHGRIRVPQAAHRIGLEGEPQDGLHRFAGAEQPDLRVDLPRPELDLRAAAHPEVLPHQEGGVRVVEPGGRDAPDAETARRRRPAADLPQILVERHERAAFVLERLDIRDAELIRRRPRRRDLGVERQRGRRRGADQRQRVQRARQGQGLEPQVGREPADEVRRRLEAERRTGERGALALQQAQHAEGTVIAEVVLRLEPVDRRGRHGERGILLVLHRHAGRLPEQRIRIDERDLPDLVVDRVVHAPPQLAPAGGNALRALADLEAAQGEQAPVVAARRVVLEPQPEQRRGPLGAQQVRRRAVQGVVAELGRQAGGVGERREVREHHEIVAQRRAPPGILLPGEQPVVLVERAGIGFLAHAEQAEERGGVAFGPLGLGHQDAQPGGLAHHVVHRAHAIGIAHFVAERRHVGRAARLEDEPQRVHDFRARRGGKRAHGVAVRRHVGHRQIVFLVQAAGQREPRARPVQVVVAAFGQQLPHERPGALLAVLAQRHRLDAAQVLLGRGAAGGGPAPVHASLAHQQRRRQVEHREIQDVHGRVAGQRGRVQHEEEPQRLEVAIHHVALLRLHGPVADREDAAPDHVPLLLREDGSGVDGAELHFRGRAEVVGRNAARNEPRVRGGEGHVADLDAPQDFVVEALVVDLDVVRRLELPLGVVVHVQVDALAHDAARAHGELRLEPGRRKPAAARAAEARRVGRRAAEVLEPVEAHLEPRVDPHAEVGVAGHRAHRRQAGAGRQQRHPGGQRVGRHAGERGAPARRLPRRDPRARRPLPLPAEGGGIRPRRHARGDERRQRRQPQRVALEPRRAQPGERIPNLRSSDRREQRDQRDNRDR